MSERWLIVSDRMADSRGLIVGRRVLMDSTKLRPWLELRMTAVSSSGTWVFWSSLGRA